MSQKRLIEYSGAAKRIFAFFIDILCTLLIAINLNNFLFSNLTRESLGTTALEEKYKDRLVDSHLYIQKDDGLCYSIDMINHDNSMNEEEYIQYLDEKLTLFYLDEDFECSNIEQYNELKKNKEDIFKYDTSLNTYIYLDNIDNEAKLKFYKDAVTYSIDKVLVNDELIEDYLNQIMRNGLISLSMSFMASMFIFFLIIPMINKNRSTIGKYMFKIGLIDLKTKEILSRQQYTLRFIVLFLETVISLMCYGGVLLISFAFTIFTKNNSSLHDFAAKSMPINLLSYSKIIEEEGELACQ